jgi:hypothetical protein
MRWDRLRRCGLVVVVDWGIEQLVHILDQAREGKVFVHFTAFEFLLNFKFEFAKLLLNFRVDVAGLF